MGFAPGTWVVGSPRNYRIAGHGEPMPSMHERISEEIQKTFLGKGRYSWTELSKWAEQCQLEDLVRFCDTMQDLMN
jgi:hypothetical protein